jgi:hypothetical protein
MLEIKEASLIVICPSVSPLHSTGILYWSAILEYYTGVLYLSTIVSCCTVVYSTPVQYCSLCTGSLFVPIVVGCNPCNPMYCTPYWGTLRVPSKSIFMVRCESVVQYCTSSNALCVFVVQSKVQYWGHSKSRERALLWYCVSQ